MIEPVFAQMKFNRGLDRFRRRGRGAVRAEWRLITPPTTSSSSTATLSRPPDGGRRPALGAPVEISPLAD
jgi:hypothetical protein